MIRVPAASDWHLGPGEPGLVSYIMPAYNIEGYIGETLESCLAQDYRPLEIVVVNDGSTDGTGGIVEDFKARHERQDFRVLHVEQANAGPSAARNAGLEASSGAIVGFLDADDLLTPRRTEMLRAGLMGSGVDLCFGSYRRFHDLDEVRAELEPPSGGVVGEPEVEDYPLMPLARDWPYVWTFLARRELIGRVGPFALELKGTEDYEYMTRLRCLGPSMARLRATVYLHRIVPGSLFAGSPRTREKVLNRYLATKLIEQGVRERGITEPESLDWVFTRVRGAATTNLRFALREEAIEAYELASSVGRGKGRLFCRCAAAFFRLPMAFGLTRAAIHVRRALLGRGNDTNTAEVTR